MLASEANLLFLRWAKSERNLTELTIRAYGCDNRQMIRRLGNLPVSEITGELLRDYFARPSLTRKYADTTMRRRIATAKVFFRFLEQEHWIRESPAKAIRGSYSIARRLPRVMSAREVRALLQSVRRPNITSRVSSEPIGLPDRILNSHTRYLRDISIFETLFLTGLRIGELTALDCSDVSLADGSIRVMGKGRRERYAYLSNLDVLETMRAYLRVRERIDVPTAALYLDSRLQRMSIYAVEFAFRKHARRARIKRHYTPHCLRHTMATMLLNNGADLRVVQELLGHRTIVTTQIYTEVSSAHKRRAIARYSGRNSLNLGPIATAEALPV